jgi:hypothetical protein
MAQAGTVAGMALLLAGASMYWARGRGERPTGALASVRKPVTIEKDAAEKASVAKSGERGPVMEATDARDAKTAAPVPDAGLALRTGEVLEYAADVAKLSNVANLRLQVVERRNFLGKSAWHLQAFAHTENPLRMVFELDDQFDSYSDAGTLSSLQYEMHLNERGQKFDSVQRMTASGKEPAPANATETRVVPGTRDPLGLMQYLRNVDWSKGKEVSSPVYDGHKLYDVRAAFAGPSGVTVPAGNFATSKIDIRVFENGVEMKDSSFTLYLADNTARTPVLLEALMPFATARVQLVKGQ